MPTLPPLPGRPWLQSAAALALCWALFDAAPAGAAEFVTIEDECNGRQLLIRGPLEPGDHERFANRLARLVAGGDLPDVQDPDVLWTVKLDSPGGDPDEAMRIGRLLREALATTDVGYRYARRPDGVWDFQRSSDLVCLDGEDRLSGCHQDIVEAECTGACVLVWLAGAERHANEGQVGLHGLTGTAAPALRDYLNEMGVAPEWVERLLDSAPSGSGWLSWPERHELAGRARRLEQLIADCPPPLSREESFQSVVSPDAEQRDALMERAEAHRSCRRARLAAARADTVARLAGRLEHDAAAAVSQRGN